MKRFPVLRFAVLLAVTEYLRPSTGRRAAGSRRTVTPPYVMPDGLRYRVRANALRSAISSTTIDTVSTDDASYGDAT